MNQALINRYQPGGDIYNALVSKYNQTVADAAAQAALSGDEGQINSALANAIYGNPLETSTIAIFTNQIATDPLAAPADWLNKLLGNSLGSLLKSPYIIGALVIGGLIYFGGMTVILEAIKAKIKK